MTRVKGPEAADKTLPELTPEEEGFHGYIMETLALDEKDLSLPITYRDMTMNIGDGVRHSLHHIIENNMSEEEIRAYVDMLLALGRQQAGA